MKNNEDKSSLSLKVKFGYGIGEFGFTFFLMFLSYYMLYFLTDIARFSSYSAAFIYSICQWSEVVTVLLIGVLIDRVSYKKGKYGIWLTLGSISCLLFAVITFGVYPFESTALKILLFIVFYTLTYAGYNAVWVAFRSLIGFVGENSEQRVKLSVTTTRFSTASGLIFSYLGTKILSAFANVNGIYAMFAGAICLIMLICVIITRKTIKRYDVYEDTLLQNDRQTTSKKISLRDYLKQLTKPMISFLFSVALRQSVATIISSLMLYYLKYVFGNASALTGYMVTVSLFSFASTFLIPVLNKRLQKNTIWKIGAVGSVFSLILAYFFGKSLPLFYAAMVLNNVFLVIGGALLPVFINDIAIYNEKTTGVDMHALSFSFGSLSLYLAQIIGSAIASFGLVVIGYDPLGVITQNVISGITVLLTLVSAGVILLSLVVFRFYKLDDETMKELEQKNKDSQINS